MNNLFGYDPKRHIKLEFTEGEDDIAFDFHKANEMNDKSKETKAMNDLSKEEIARNAYVSMKGHSIAASKIRCIENAMQEYADQQAIAYKKEIEKLNRIIDLKESERKEWVESCIKKQE